MTRFQLGQKVSYRKFNSDPIHGVVAGITLPGGPQYLVIQGDDVEACYGKGDREWCPEHWLEERAADA